MAEVTTEQSAESLAKKELDAKKAAEAERIKKKQEEKRAKDAAKKEAEKAEAEAKKAEKAKIKASAAAAAKEQLVTSAKESSGPEAYPWNAPGPKRLKKMERRRAELIKLEYNNDPKLREEWTQLLIARNAAEEEEEEEKENKTEDSGAAKESDVASGREPPPLSPEEKASHDNAEEEKKKKAAATKSGGLFGWFSSKSQEEEDEEEEVPEHDLDENGNPLTRLELLRRQSKRQKQQKRKAALDAKRKKTGGTPKIEAASQEPQGSKPVVEEPSAASEPSPSAADSAETENQAVESDTEDEAPEIPKSEPTQAFGDSDSSDDEEQSKSKPSALTLEPKELGSGNDSNEETNDEVTEASDSGSGITSEVAKELLNAIAELRADRDSLKSEVSDLRRELGQVKAELGRMKMGGAAGAGPSSSAASAVYGWYQSEVASPRDYYLKLTQRRVELQDRARPGIQDPTQKELWSTEWAALNAEIDVVGLQMNQLGLQPAGVGGPIDDKPATPATADVLAGDVSYHTIVAFGGRVGTLDAVGFVERFDVSQKTWVPLAPLPTVRFGLSCSTLHGYGYLVGGKQQWRFGVSETCTLTPLSFAGSAASGGSLNTVERYDLATNRWEHVASCSTTRAGLATSILNDHLYAVGGASDQLFGSVRTLSVSLFRKTV